MDGSCSTYSDRSSVCRVTIGKPGGKRRLGRTKLRRGIIINIYTRIKEIGLQSAQFIHLAYDTDMGVQL